MSNEYLPLKVDPFRFADNATRINGLLPIQNMQRLCASLAADTGNVEVKASFGVDEQGIRFLRGQLETHLTLQCQRCMESFSYAIIGDFRLGIVQTDEEADELPGHYDPLIVKGDELLIQDVIEDELIVALPIVPMHNEADCKVQLPVITEIGDYVEVEKDNPFKVIELLRSKRNTEK